MIAILIVIAVTACLAPIWTYRWQLPKGWLDLVPAAISTADNWHRHLYRSLCQQLP